MINLDGTIASGMYLVNLTAGEQTFIQRLVDQVAEPLFVKRPARLSGALCVEPLPVPNMHMLHEAPFRGGMCCRRFPQVSLG